MFEFKKSPVYNSRTKNYDVKVLVFTRLDEHNVLANDAQEYEFKLLEKMQLLEDSVEDLGAHYIELQQDYINRFLGAWTQFKQNNGLSKEQGYPLTYLSGISEGERLQLELLGLTTIEAVSRAKKEVLALNHLYHAQDKAKKALEDFNKLNKEEVNDGLSRALANINAQNLSLQEKNDAQAKLIGELQAKLGLGNKK